MKKLLNILFVSLLFSFSVYAQIPRPLSTPPVQENEPPRQPEAAIRQKDAAPPNEEDVVKISTALIQLDVVVTDKNGNLITDLKPEDFEITENGERQTITNLSYFSGRKISTTSANLNAVGGLNQTMPTLGEVRRTVAIVVDDAGLAGSSISQVKKHLTKFINEEVLPGDLVAIIKTSGSVGVLQQFTTDKTKLLSIVENLKYQPLTSSGLSPFAPISISFAQQIQSNMGGELTGKSKTILEERTSVEFLNNLGKNIVVTAGSLGVLNSTINAMSRMPGRKSVLYVADGVFSIFGSISPGGTNNRNARGGNLAGQVNAESSSSIFADSSELEEKLRGITEIANRASIAIYTLDPRGTLPIGLSADFSTREGMFSSTSAAEIDSNLTRDNNQFKASQLGLKFLSSETSGKAFINTNDIGKGLRETLDSQNGYYIIAYQPDNETFDVSKRRFNKLNVKVKRPNVNVSYRSGFFNIAEMTEEQVAATPERIFLQRLFSPYKYSDVDLRITSIYAPDEQATTVRSFISIKPEDLQFIADANGDKTAQFDLVAVAFNEDGIPISQVAKRFDIKVSQKDYEKLLQEGIASSLSFATRVKGAQQVKVAVRDVNTNKIGTASQTVVVPNFDKESISLSGLLLQNYTMQEWQSIQSGKAPPINAAEAANRTQANTARRQFKKGTVLSFNYAIYTAPSFRSKSQVQFAIFKDGKEVSKGSPAELNIASTGKMQRTNRGGAFLLGTDMAAGRYVLQVSVTGDAVKEPEIQQIDFELIN
jgi:VWFA-related protein